MRPFPSKLQALIAHLKKFPGVGKKTAERFAFQLLDWPADEIKKFASHLDDLHETVTPCSHCGCLQEANECFFCHLTNREQATLCLVSSPRDVYAIEETGAFKGFYHVLGSLLSPIDGKEIEPVVIEKLKNRISTDQIKEVILALDSTLEGDATSLFLKKELDSLGVQTTRLAFGLPMGSSLDFVDYGTLEKAFTGRQRM